MDEAQTERLIALYSAELLGPGLSVHSQQERLDSERTDLILQDSTGAPLVPAKRANRSICDGR